MSCVNHIKKSIHLRVLAFRDYCSLFMPGYNFCIFDQASDFVGCQLSFNRNAMLDPAAIEELELDLLFLGVQQKVEVNML